MPTVVPAYNIFNLWKNILCIVLHDFTCGHQRGVGGDDGDHDGMVKVVVMMAPIRSEI